MSARTFSGDRIFFIIVVLLVVGGLAMFASAALGLLAREDGSPWRIATTQFVLGLLPGVIALVAARFAPPKWLMKAALPLYIFTVALTASVFIPGIGETYNGATRWIDFGFATIQPGEFLKVGVILMLAVYLGNARSRLHDIKQGLIPFCVIVGIPTLILLMQPNTSTVLVIGAASVALYMLAGAPKRDFLILAGIAVVGLALLVMVRPYLLDRVMTYMDPSRDSLGSGQFAGRGFGQSVQKFNYLPEPAGDSVFAVVSEEFGFIGSVIIVLLFTAFAARGFSIAAEASSAFGSLVATGLTLIITISAFLNIGAMLGVLPLTGLPLPFISHGGTALFTALASVGIILNVAANRTKRRA
jgi:cell division protein FtsW